jgi:hypothetical protein
MVTIQMDDRLDLGQEFSRWQRATATAAAVLKINAFGMFKRAQALGDLDALRQHGRRVVRVHLGTDVSQGLAALGQAVEAAMAGGIR